MKALDGEVRVISDCLAMSPKDQPPSKLRNGSIYVQVNGHTGQHCVHNGHATDSETNCHQNGDTVDPRALCDCLKMSNAHVKSFKSCLHTAETRTYLNGCMNESDSGAASCLVNGVTQVATKLNGRAQVNGVESEGESLESLADDGASRRSRSPPEDIPKPRLPVDSGLESAASSWDQAETRLRDELHQAREQLKVKDDEVVRLTRVRAEVEAELEDLTASLFQEAHNMVRMANEGQAAAEKALRESNMQVDVLTAEVAALKTLVLTSTPSRPNPHLHPQIDPKAREDSSSSSGTALFRKHRRSPSHFNLKYGRENSPPESPSRDPKPPPPSEPVDLREPVAEVDPVLYREFVAWQERPTLDQKDVFLSRIYQEDITHCLSFSNSQLAAEVRTAVLSDTIFIEAVNEKTKTLFPKKCALLEAQRICQYRMRLGDTDNWYSISQICRNRIIGVCDFLNYLKYIQRGLVKSTVNDMYWEVVRLRKEMVLARLGLPLSP